MTILIDLWIAIYLILLHHTLNHLLMVLILHHMRLFILLKTLSYNHISLIIFN